MVVQHDRCTDEHPADCDCILLYSPTTLSRNQAVLDSIYIARESGGPEALLRCLQRAKTLLDRPGAPPLRLILIDSVGHVFRDVDESEVGGPAAYAARTALLFRLAALLKKYADEHSLAAVAVNQVALCL